MLAAVPAAPAGFRYLPPDEPAPAAAEPASNQGAWRVRANDTLRETLDRWGARAGVDVLFLTDRRYRLDADRSFRGAFAQAARALFSALSHLPRPPVGTFAEDGRTLTVLHRAPSAGDGR